MSYDTPLSASGQALTNLPLREQLRRGFKDMGVRSFSSAKNFGLVGAIFAGTECCIEGVRLSLPYTYDGCRGLTMPSIASIGPRTILQMASLLGALQEERWVQKLAPRLLLLAAQALRLLAQPSMPT